MSHDLSEVCSTDTHTRKTVVLMSQPDAAHVCTQDLCCGSSQESEEWLGLEPHYSSETLCIELEIHTGPLLWEAHKRVKSGR